MNYIWDESREPLFFGTERDLNALTSLADNCLKILKESTNPREMVLETWLLLDFTLRQFLLSGFELARFCDDDFDLRYIIFPLSFSALLDIFEKTIKYNSKFPLEPEPHLQDKMGGFRASYEFYSYVKKNHKDVYEKIQEITKEYQLKMNPELRDHISRGGEIAFLPQYITHETKRSLEKMNLGWRKVASKFDESWFKLAKQLNKARNIAAHSFDVNKIGQPFGLTGDNISDLIRDKCRSILNILLAVRTDEN